MTGATLLTTCRRCSGPQRRHHCALSRGIRKESSPRLRRSTRLLPRRRNRSTRNAKMNKLWILKKVARQLDKSRPRRVRPPPTLEIVLDAGAYVLCRYTTDDSYTHSS